MINARRRRLASLAVVAAASESTGLFAVAPSAVADNGIASRSYQQNNLVSDIPGLAAHTDPNLRNSWGTSTGPGLPIWVSDNATGQATLGDSVLWHDSVDFTGDRRGRVQAMLGISGVLRSGRSS